MAFIDQHSVEPRKTRIASYRVAVQFCLDTQGFLERANKHRRGGGVGKLIDA
ncbi:hypothetical protein [Mycolicibacterium fortuitum]|uniref:Uncharacterized protein n=1 Tax=Mycolicibacterium fortuitum TaxID=1766 RepID=A0AAE4VL82_MYCFO|nr:hypothetical protein [Mycolicibacterium fortuitum]MDG5779028.1 hypothetical protein [Mycolicibacterium fortuitum]MDV7209387.1 hypothetical protein [Mycolicibacterium fortuitum]MDV7231241.1 hypothetical protein [Mycolicibacterium fortuitum]MDV7295614.1 hypothetical protein [Mycolicibacterium fortuitum]MDV7309911.1 hypothetical protein [Mycolicibacterium fortuitum]